MDAVFCAIGEWARAANAPRHTAEPCEGCWSQVAQSRTLQSLQLGAVPSLARWSASIAVGAVLGALFGFLLPKMGWFLFVACPAMAAAYIRWLNGPTAGS